MLQVGVPVECVEDEEGERKDDSGNFVDLRDRVQSLLRIVEGSDDAAFATTFVLC